MQNKTQISLTRKILYTIMLLGIFFSIFGGEDLSSVRAQEEIDTPTPDAVIVDYLFTESDLLPQEAKDAIALALKKWPYQPPINGRFSLLSLRWEKTWALTTLSSADLTSPPSVEQEPSVLNGKLASLVLVYDNNEWIAAVEGDSNARVLLNLIPENELSNDAKNALLATDNETDSQSAYNSYKFPWPSDRPWHNHGGWHGTSNLAIDLDVVDNTNSDVLSAAPGTITSLVTCSPSDHYILRITTDNTSEKIGYIHLDGASVRAEGLVQGNHVAQGRKLGVMAGAFTSGGDTCGIVSTGTHLHLEFPMKPFTIDGKTYTDTYWYDGVNLYSTNGGGDSCSGPSLYTPPDSYISGSQTITFSWSTVSGCTFNGYTFRINDSSNMDDSPFVDTGEGGTSRTETIGTEWNNRDLWWGVKAANAPNGASWSVRKFRIESGGSCPSVSGEVRAYDSPNCGGTYVTANNTGLWTFVPDFNDRAEAIAIPGGWSARLYQNDNENSNESICFGSTDSNLNDNTFANGGVVGNNATWMRVYGNDNCTDNSAPSTPSNFRFDSSTQTSITIAWDDVSNETGYKIYKWNGSTTTFDYLASVGSNTTSYTETRSTCGWDEYYEISAYNSYGESTHAAFVHGYTQDCSADDNYEDNDTLATAYNLSSSEQTWLSAVNGHGAQADDDWYRIYVTPGYENVLIDLRFTHSQGDIDVKLYDSAGNVLASSTSTSDNEYIDYTVSTGETYYYIKVYYGNNGNRYDLWWDDIQYTPAFSLFLPLILR